VRARLQTVEALDHAAAKVQKGLRVFLRDEAPLEALAKRLDRKNDGRRNGTTNGHLNGKGSNGRGNGHDDVEGDGGEVNVVVMLGNGAEVEVKLPGRYKVTPQIAGAIKAVPGVIEVQAL
jgi:DNA polymerase III subunit alpha